MIPIFGATCLTGLRVASLLTLIRICISLVVCLNEFRIDNFNLILARHHVLCAFRADHINLMLGTLGLLSWSSLLLQFCHPLYVHGFTHFLFFVSDRLFATCRVRNHQTWILRCLRIGLDAIELIKRIMLNYGLGLSSMSDMRSRIAEHFWCLIQC